MWYTTLITCVTLAAAISLGVLIGIWITLIQFVTPQPWTLSSSPTSLPAGRIQIRLQPCLLSRLVSQKLFHCALRLCLFPACNNRRAMAVIECAAECDALATPNWEFSVQAPSFRTISLNPRGSSLASDITATCFVVLIVLFVFLVFFLLHDTWSGLELRSNTKILQG